MKAAKPHNLSISYTQNITQKRNQSSYNPYVIGIIVYDTVN